MSEYTVYLDSSQREKTLVTGDNPTNDVVIPVPLLSGRLPVAEMHLGSLEMPLAQYTVESAWSEFYFDEGLDLLVQDQASLGITQFSIQEDTNVITAQLPPAINFIVDVQNNGTASPIFTTFFPHALELIGAYNWGQSIQLISTPIVDPALYNLDTNNANLIILSETQFQLNLPAPVTFTTAGSIFGFLRAPTIPNPTILAQLVTAALNLIAPGHWVVTYNHHTGRFKLCWASNGCAARDASPSILLIECQNSLPTIMGFGNVNVVIPLPPPETRLPLSDMDLIRLRDNVPDYKEPCLISVNCYQCKSHITIDPGNYQANDLGANLARQWNRFYFDQGCVGATPTPSELVFSDTCGNCYTVQIPFGKYTPETLADYLQTQMNTILPGSNFVVSWDSATGQFTFQADITFGLEFDTTAGSQDLANRLGYLPVCYRNENIYASTRPFYIPIRGCCFTNIPERTNSYVYVPFIMGTERKYIIERCKPRGIAATGAANPYSPPFFPANTGFTDNADGTASITYPFAHGYQPNDIIEISFPAAPPPASGPGPYFVRVVEVVNFQTVIVDVGSIDTAGLTDAPVCTILAGPIVGNVYFAPCDGGGANPSPILSNILGFAQQDYFPPVTSTTWVAPSCLGLDYPNYLLLQVTVPNGATHNSHAWGDDNRSQILSKIILYPQYRLERSFPMRLIMGDLRIVNKIRMQLLNPDHSLYMLHGKNWSCTIVFTVVEQNIKQVCY